MYADWFESVLSNQHNGETILEDMQRILRGHVDVWKNIELNIEHRVKGLRLDIPIEVRY